MFPSLPSLAAALSQPFKRSQLGLFHGKTKQYGNNVPFSKKKTRRSWLPNIQTKRFFSDALGEKVRVKLSMRALKTIRKHGGIDQYVLNTKADLLGWEGMRLRVAVREAQERNTLEASTSPSAAPTHGASLTRPIPTTSSRILISASAPP
ncbi:hypothetical protein EDB84DRAFT_1465572 [Lactarius hengduanensis]|nr:hypothetical protein EDB84DRAFT_1465572 [Lactarius hengduanensis]